MTPRSSSSRRSELKAVFLYFVSVFPFGFLAGHSSTRDRDNCKMGSSGREFALKSHRLLHQRHIKKKLSTSRIQVLSKGKPEKEAEQAELSSKVDQEIKELEAEIMAKLAANILQEITAIESIAHGSLDFVSPDVQYLKQEFMSGE